MSFIKDVESEIGKAEKALASWWGKEPAFANVLSIGVTTVGTSLETIFTLEGNGPAATLVGNIVSAAQQKLLAINSLVTTIGTTASVKSVLQGIVTDIAPLETAIDVKNPTSQAALTLAVNTLNNLVDGFPASTTTTAAPAGAPLVITS